MSFVFAYGLDGNSTQSINDMPLDSVENYGEGGPKKGDLVALVDGLLQRATDATDAADVVGVYEGGEFLGLAQGNIYEAVNSSFTFEGINEDKFPNGVGKVRQDKTAAVYKVPVLEDQDALTAGIGDEFGIAIVDGEQFVDLEAATAVVKVEDVSLDGEFVYVTLL